MSQRVLIIGVGESGKTTLANRLIETANIPVFIRDPVYAEWAKCTARFESSEELRNLIRPLERSPCIVVVDEAYDWLGVSDRQNHWVFINGRHFGILPIAIAHRVKMMSPNIRDQATDLYIFECSNEAAAIMAEAYNMPDILEAPNLGAGEFFHVRRIPGDRKRILTVHKLW